VYLARPAFIVFVRDQFQVVSAAQLDPDELARARYPEFREPPVDGPHLAFAELPTDPGELKQLAIFGVLGHDMEKFPKLFVPYAERTDAVLSNAWTLARTRELEPQAAKVVEAWLAQSEMRETDVRYLRVRARRAWMAAVIDAKTAQPMKLLITESMR